MRRNRMYTRVPENLVTVMPSVRRRSSGDRLGYGGGVFAPYRMRRRIQRFGGTFDEYSCVNRKKGGPKGRCLVRLLRSRDEIPTRFFITNQQHTCGAGGIPPPVFVPVDEDLTDRKTFILDNPELFSDVKVHLFYSSLNLWTHLLRLYSTDDIDLRNFDLDVEESVILDILVDEKVSDEITSETLIDYYIFFKKMVMWKEVKIIIDTLVKRKLEILDSYILFRLMLMKYEPTSVSNMINGSIEDNENQSNSVYQFLSEGDFRSCLTLYLFISMKKIIPLIPETETNEVLIELLRSDVATIKDYKQHAEYKRLQNEQVLIDANYFSKLRNGLRKNLDLVPSEELQFQEDIRTTFPSHLVLLCLRTNFFHRMVSFGGQEFEQFKTRGKIVLDGLLSDPKMVSLLLDYVYFGEDLVKQKNRFFKYTFDVLIKMMIHCDMFDESVLYSFVIQKMGEIKKTDRKLEIESVLNEYGHLIQKTEMKRDMKSDLVPQLEKLEDSKEEDDQAKISIYQGSSFGNVSIWPTWGRKIWNRGKIEDMLKESNYRQQFIESLEGSYKNEMERLREENELLKRQNSKLQSVIGKARKRERTEIDYFNSTDSGDQSNSGGSHLGDFDIDNEDVEMNGGVNGDGDGLDIWLYDPFGAQLSQEFEMLALMESSDDESSNRAIKRRKIQQDDV